MNCRWVIVSLFTLCPLLSFGQIQQLNNQVDNAIHLSEMALFDADMDKALSLVAPSNFNSEQGFQALHEIKLRLQQIRIAGFANILHRQPTDYQSRLQTLLSLQPGALQLADRSVKAAYLLALSGAYRSMAQADSAAYYEDQAIQLYQSLNDQEQLANIRANSISRQHNALLVSNQKEAILKLIPSYEEEIRYSAIHSRYALAYNTRHLAQIHRRQTFNYPKAIELFKQSLALRQEIGFKPFIPASLSSLGDVYMAMKEWQQAIEVYEQSAQLAADIGFVRYKYYPMLQTGRIYEQMGDNAKALQYYQKAYSAAIEDQYTEAAKEAGSAIERLKK